MKKLLSVFLALVMLLSLGTVAFAASPVASGSCGENLTWTLDSDGVLRISGTGNMNAFYGPQPWRDRIMDIKAVIIEPGVTSVGDNAFYFTGSSSTNIASVTLSNTVENIGSHAFICCQITSIDLPAGVKTVEEYAFASCKNLATVKLTSNIEMVEYMAFDHRSMNVVYDGTMEQWEAFSKNTQFRFSESTIQTTTGSAILCPWCGKYHVEKNFFDKIKVFFHTVFAELFGYKYY